MKVIERYIMRRTLLVFLAALFWTLAIVWTTQVLAKIDLVTDSGQSALTFFEIAALILPSIIPIVVPFAIVRGRGPDAERDEHGFRARRRSAPRAASRSARSCGRS